MVEGVGQKEAKGAGFWGQGTTQSRRRNAPHRLKLGGLLAVSKYRTSYFPKTTNFLAIHN